MTEVAQSNQPVRGHALYRLRPMQSFVGALTLADLDLAFSPEQCAEIRKLWCNVINKVAASPIESAWDGTFAEGPACFFLPASNLVMAVGFMWSQESYGATFVAAPCNMPHLLQCGTYVGVIPY